MKKLISFSLFLITASLLVWSCSKTENSAGSGKDRHAARSAYLNSLYRQGYEIVREKTFFADGQNMLLSEIHPYGSQVKAYTVEKTGSYDLLYFLSYDPQKGQLVIHDFMNNESDIFHWNGEYVAKSIQGQPGFDPFDLIDKMQANNQAKKRHPFIGWGCDDDVYDPGPICYHRCCHYVFWIKQKGTCCTITCDKDRCE